jgi:hypothetical protein
MEKSQGVPPLLWLRTFVGSATATLLFAAAFLAPAVAGDRLVASLDAGESAFWHSPFIRRATNNERGGSCKEGCFVYRIEVAERAARLRVAIDYPMGNDLLDLRLRDPSGKRVRPQPSGFYSREIFVRRPRRGTWSVEVIPRFVSKTAFRLRAKLESDPKDSGGRRLLAPNLRLEPPFEFTFRPPVTMAAGVTVDAGRSEARGSCGVDETAEDSAQRCLRLAVGPQNAGDGPLELRFSPVTDAATAEAPMYQLLHYSDGTTRERRAGSYEYHKAHGHYHFSGFATIRLFRVNDRRTGGLESAGAGQKSGFCFGDVMMNSWRRFIQDRAGSSRSSCSDFSEAYMGLSTGWTDIYDSATPGNYVEFGDNPDDYYVLRATVDAHDVILETNEDDNVSYAYIRVQGNHVRILERGLGLSPWDPNKTVYVDWVKLLARRG